jgi:hypothetical protein
MLELHAGWARITLTLPTDYPMTGYIARQQTSQGILDPLYVRALVLEQGQFRMAVLVVDLLLMSSAWAAHLRKLAAESLQTSVEHVVIAATHTHSGPLIDTSPFELSRSRPDERTDQLMHTLERQCVQAVVEARSRLRRVSVSHLRCPIRGLATDRTRRSRERIQWLHLIRFQSADGSALFGVLPSHSTVLGAANARYSGDLHGEVARLYEKQFDVALIANGAAANISTRFTRSSQTPTQVRRFAASILRQADLRHFRACAPFELRSASRVVLLPIRDLRKAPDTLVQRSGRVAAVMREGAIVARQLSKTKEFRRKLASVSVTVIRLGPISLAALPLELYAETGRFLWSHAHVIALCYANGYWGYVYVPGAKPFDYEVVSSPFEERADAIVRQAVVDIQEHQR